MESASSPKSSQLSSESPRSPPLKSPRPSVPTSSPSSRSPTLVSSSRAVEPRPNNKKRARQATSNGEAFPYKCKCGKQFRTAQEYGGHQNAHTRPKKFMNKCLERVRLNCLMLPGYSLPPDSPTFLQEEVARLKKRNGMEDTGFGRILSPVEMVNMHPYHSNRNPIVKNTALPNPSLPFDSFDPKLFEFCRTVHEAGLGANDTTAYLPKASFAHSQLAPGGVNLDLASRKFVSFWNPDRGSENWMPHRGASAVMRESALPPQASGNSGNSGGNVLTRPGLAPRHVEDDNPSGLDLELRL